jgi:hypothetical protein
MRHVLFRLTSALVVVAGGCVSVPMAKPEEDLAAKEFKAPGPAANLYVYRNDKLRGSGLKLGVKLDGVHLGDLLRLTYLHALIAPGRHALTSTNAENDLIFEAQAGGNYFVWDEMDIGLLSWQSVVHQVDESTGKAVVLKCELAETKAPPLSALK